MKTKQLNFRSCEQIKEYDTLIFFKPIGSNLTRLWRIPETVLSRTDEIHQILDATCTIRRNGVWYYRDKEICIWAMAKLIDIDIPCFFMEPEELGLDDMGWPIPQFLN